MLVGMSAFPPGEIPDFKPAAAADERDLALQFQPTTKIIRQEQSALFVERTVLGLGMQLPQVNAEIPRRDSGKVLSCGADSIEFFRCHDEEKLAIGFRDHDEVFGGAMAAPAGGNGDTIFVIDLMTEFARVKN
jgi:hypothetical protein